MATMSALSGTINEFPFIGVDRFNSQARVFLLTHCHADHLAGFTNKSLAGPVYCSTETLLLLKTDPKYTAALRLVKGLPYNTPTVVESGDASDAPVCITLIEAYHCPGACMFLIELIPPETGCKLKFESKPDEGSSSESTHQNPVAVLCTGDLRAEAWWRESLHASPQLFPYLSGLKRLDNIYFDSTFAYRGEPYIEMPPNNAGIHTAICMLKNYPQNDPEICFEFSDTTLGFEQAWALITIFFRGSLTVEDALLRRKLRVIAKHNKIYGPLLHSLLAREPSEQRPHFAAGRARSGAVSVKIKQCIEFNIMDYASFCCPISLDTVGENESMTLLKQTQKGNQVFAFRDREWLLPHNGKELLPMVVKLIFSRHASFSELREFFSMFQPRQVFPSFTTESWKGLSIKRLFADCCSGEEFDFDRLIPTPLAKEVMERPVATINRWSIEECEQERELVEKVVSEGKREKRRKPALIQLRQVAKTKAFSTKSRLPQSFAMQKLVDGRRDTYNAFMKEQQMLYYKKHNHPGYHGTKASRTSVLAAYGGSSDYDTDDSGSSLDMHGVVKRHFSNESSEPSFIPETQKRAPHRRRRSFVCSTYSSAEESREPAHPIAACSLVFRSSAKYSQRRVEKLSEYLRLDPPGWQHFCLGS